MTLLRELQDLASDAEIDVASVLLKGKILAARLDNAPLRNWIESELNGYAAVKGLPEYRVLRQVAVAGDFVGPFGAQMRNGPVPSSVVPAEIREQFETVFLTEPIGVYWRMTRQQRTGSFRIDFPTNMAVLLSNKVYRGMQCLSAWHVIPDLRSAVRAFDYPA